MRSVTKQMSFLTSRDDQRSTSERKLQNRIQALFDISEENIFPVCLDTRKQT